ncbi:MAG: hypothetical protein PF489_02640 [Salinivirgaceae bacterium]|jgi:hypothetical protein|nr:hypothetical protein [Salinivirgaceae bacterium]
MKNKNLTKRLYAGISISFAILIVVEGLFRQYISNPLLVKIIDYAFWYFFGLFSVFFILRRIELRKEKDDFGSQNMMNKN